MSRKCTVSADRISASPSVNTSCTSTTSGNQSSSPADQRPVVVDQERRRGSAGPRKKCTMFASTVTIGSTSAGNSTFLIRLPPEISDAGRLDQRRREPGPRQDAAEHEQRVRLDPLDRARRHHEREDERVDEQQQQRVDEGPEEAEHRAAVARLQLARDQALDQPAVAEQLREVMEHRSSRHQRR